MQPKPLHELCLKGKSKLEIQAQDLLEQLLDPDSHEKLMMLFAQLPHLGRLLGGNEVPNELRSQWRAKIREKVSTMDVTDEVILGVLVSMEKSLSAHVSEVSEKLQELHRHLVECEEEFYASLEKDCMESLDDDFAAFCTWAVRACKFEATSAEATNKIGAVLARLLQYVQEKRSRLETDIEQLNLEEATTHRQQLEQLRGFLEGEFLKSSERLQSICGKSWEQVGQVKKHLRKIQPKSLRKLCLQVSNKLESNAQDLLEHLLDSDSHAKLAPLFAQLPHLGRLLGGNEVPDELRTQWRDRVQETVRDMHRGFADGAPLPFTRLRRLAAMSESLGTHVPEVTDEVGKWKTWIKEAIQKVANDAEGDVEQWRKDNSHVCAVNLGKAFINLASMHMNLPSPAFADLAEVARTYIAELLNQCWALPKFHHLVLKLRAQLQSKDLDSNQSMHGKWILTAFPQFADWRTADFNKKTMKKSADEILQEWNLPEADELLLKTRSLASVFESCESHACCMPGDFPSQDMASMSRSTEAS